MASRGSMRDDLVVVAARGWVSWLVAICTATESRLGARSERCSAVRKLLGHMATCIMVPLSMRASVEYPRWS
jgi:hypothetical protein